DVDLDQRDRMAAQPSGELAELVDRTAGDRHRGADALRVEPRQVAVEEDVDAGSLQPDGVEHAAGGLGHPWGRPAGSWLELDRLGDHAADRGEVVEGRELLAGGGAAAGREDRVGHLEAAEAGADVDTSRAFEGIVVVTEDDLAHLREP